MSVNWGNQQILPFNKREKSTRVSERAKTNVMNVPLDPVTPPVSDMLYVTHNGNMYPVEVKNNVPKVNGGTRKHKTKKRKTRKH